MMFAIQGDQKMKTTVTPTIALLALFVSMTIANNSNAQDAAAKPEAGKQVELSFKTSDGTEVGYLLYLPKGYDTTGEKKAPVMLFLHGRGESNGPLSLVAKWGPPQLVEGGQDMPFLIVSPQCPKDCLLYTSPSPRDGLLSRMPSSA